MRSSLDAARGHARPGVRRRNTFALSLFLAAAVVLAWPTERLAQAESGASEGDTVSVSDRERLLMRSLVGARPRDEARIRLEAAREAYAQALFDWVLAENMLAGFLVGPEIDQWEQRSIRATQADLVRYETSSLDGIREILREKLSSSPDDEDPQSPP